MGTVASARAGPTVIKKEEEVSRRPANESRQEAEKRFLLATVRINDGISAQEDPRRSEREEQTRAVFKSDSVFNIPKLGI